MIDIDNIKTLYMIFDYKLTESRVVLVTFSRANAVKYIVCRTAVIKMLTKRLIASVFMSRILASPIYLHKTMVFSADSH